MNTSWPTKHTHHHVCHWPGLSRLAFATFDAFATRLGLEFAPFVDVGKVFADSDGSPLSHPHRAAGVGIRGIASPNVVGYVDIGYGSEKAAVFSGINYPF